MLVAHRVLLQHSQAPLLARFRRWLARCCRLDLAHFSQSLRYQCDRPPPGARWPGLTWLFEPLTAVAELLQGDIPAALAAHRPFLWGTMQRLSAGEREAILAEVARLSALSPVHFGAVHGSGVSDSGSEWTALQAFVRFVDPTAWARQHSCCGAQHKCLHQGLQQLCQCVDCNMGRSMRAKHGPAQMVPVRDICAAHAIW